jgi:AcrR family transcriptional regulator
VATRPRASASARKSPDLAGNEPVADRILNVALQIIKETGDFDLPMRQLAAQAKVSLRTPYVIFGSKSGLISKILQRDQAQWRARLRALQTGDPVEDLFLNLQRGEEFFLTHQQFYKALYRATQVYSAGDESESAREVLRPFQIACSRLAKSGLFAPNVDPMIVAETLTDIFVGTQREWAMSAIDIRHVSLRCRFGVAAVLAGCAVEDASRRLSARALGYQAELQALREATPAAEG